ncbi:TetR/AcrR family transcriptional regulator [Rhodopseudomonas palustris]|uniref:TetR/AcrR family transcriptional regulator n=1 Tax=Rhodopseudomonas palustris TaxID=1076 RepID=UPI0024C09357|nr:TetR/AcrR family transcriptional regulator [Rhodopseudomonas palustris]
MEDNGLARRSSDPARVREKILKLAMEEFARTGFDGARVDRIAERSKVSKNMLYYYFKSKEGLFVAALERMYEEVRDQQRELSVRAHDPIMAMKQLVEHTFSALESNPNAIRLMNEENKQRGRFLRKSKRIRDLYNPLVETISFILERGRAEGVFRPGLDSAVVYMTLSSLCYHYLSNRYTLEIALGKDLDSAASRKTWVEHVGDIVLMYCTTERPATAAPKAAATRQRATFDADA